jgi:hypothetical protein
MSADPDERVTASGRRRKLWRFEQMNLSPMALYAVALSFQKTDWLQSVSIMKIE